MTLSVPAFLSMLFLLSVVGPGWRPQITDFELRGNAYRTTENCLRLTEAQDYMAGSIWYKHPVNLLRPFAFELSLMVGCDDAGGADGMVFVMTKKGNQTGYVGEGIGFAGLVPSVGIEVDTWRNYHLNDPAEDHVAIMLNGRMGHYRNLAGPNIIKNIEDCRKHSFIVRWDPAEKRLSVDIDRKEVITAKVDLIKGIFGGDPIVHWGVTAATGRYNNVHEVCFEKLDWTPGTTRRGN